MDRNCPNSPGLSLDAAFEVPLLQIGLKIRLDISTDTEAGIAHQQDHLHNGVFPPAPQHLQLLVRERLIVNLRFCLRHDNISAKVFPAQFPRDGIPIQILNQADHIPNRGSAVLFPDLIDPILPFLDRNIIQ